MSQFYNGQKNVILRLAVSCKYFYGFSCIYTTPVIPAHCSLLFPIPESPQDLNIWFQVQIGLVLTSLH